LTDVLVLMEIQVNMSKQCLAMLVYIVQYRTLYLNFVSIQGFTGCSKITFLQYILFLLTYCKQCFQFKLEMI